MGGCSHLVHSPSSPFPIRVWVVQHMTLEHFHANNELLGCSQLVLKVSRGLAYDQLKILSLRISTA